LEPHFEQPESLPVFSALRALGELLADQNQTASVVVVGGTAMILQGFVNRVTGDVDVIAIGSGQGEQKPTGIEIARADAGNARLSDPHRR
jgi:hypothetical protein